VQAGIVSSLDEAFERFLKKNRPAFVPKFKMSASVAIDLIHEAGGLAVLAHPGLNHADEVIRPMAEAGLDGIECFSHQALDLDVRALPGDRRSAEAARDRRVGLSRV
jgi:predicted metal-dependent phosphoesterase TrpH